MKMSCRSADSSVDFEDRMGARAAQAATPNVFPERSICVILADEAVRGSMYFSRSSLVSILRPLPARENIVEASAMIAKCDKVNRNEMRGRIVVYAGGGWTRIV